MNQLIFPELTTERLILRQIQTSDVKEVLFLRSDKEVNQFIERPVSRQTSTIESALNHIEKLNHQFKTHKSISWGITLKEHTKMIGSICLWNFSEANKTAEVGFDLHPKYQNKGYMTEALKMVLNYGFNTLDFQKIEAYTSFKNKNSIALLTKNGFQLNSSKTDSDNSDNIVFEIKL